MNKNKDFMDGFQDHRKANTDKHLMPKNVKAHLKAKGEQYEKGWKQAKGMKWPE